MNIEACLAGCPISFSEWHSGTYVPVFDDLPSLESTPLMLTRKNLSDEVLEQCYAF